MVSPDARHTSKYSVAIAVAVDLCPACFNGGSCTNATCFCPVGGGFTGSSCTEPAATPTIVSAQADDDGGRGGLNSGDTIYVTFSNDTDQGQLASMPQLEGSEVEGLIQLQPHVATSTSQQWLDSSHLQLTIVCPVESSVFGDVFTESMALSSTVSMQANQTFPVRDVTRLSTPVTGSVGITGSFGGEAQAPMLALSYWCHQVLSLPP